MKKPLKPKDHPKGQAGKPTPSAQLRAGGRGGTGWHKDFLKMLRQSCNVTLASDSVGINRETAYSHKKKFKAFAASWDQAIEAAIDMLEASAWQKATRGMKEPIFMRDKEGNPKQVGEVVKYDSQLHALLLRSHRPSKYRETLRTELSGPEGGVIKFDAPPATVIILPAKREIAEHAEESVAANGNGHPARH